MSMIDRYKKKGGFIQLLNLMETCGTQKQEKFLKMIEEEDMSWAEAVKAKMLSVKRIFSWDDNTVAEIVGTLNDMTVSLTLLGVEPDVKEKIVKTLNHSRKRKIEEDMAERKPTPAEISTAFVQVLTQVRKMVSDGFLYLEKIDPVLVVNSEFEDQLLAGQFGSGAVKSTSLDMSAVQGSKDEELKKKLVDLKSENDTLREKLSQAEAKLSQIRKIA
jgi:hypothetical protein